MGASAQVGKRLGVAVLLVASAYLVPMCGTGERRARCEGAGGVYFTPAHTEQCVFPKAGDEPGFRCPVFYPLRGDDTSDGAAFCYAVL